MKKKGVQKHAEFYLILFNCKETIGICKKLYISKIYIVFSIKIWPF